MEEIRDLLNEIEIRLSNRYVVLDGDDCCICVKERKSGKHYDISRRIIYERRGTDNEKR